MVRTGAFPRPLGLLSALLLTVALIAHGRISAAEPLVLIGPPWPPFLYEQDPRTGLASEIVIAAFEAVDQPVEMQPTPWRRVIWMAQQGDVDGLIGVWPADDREDFIVFSEPYYLSRIVIAYHKDYPPDGESQEDLAGLKVGVREGAFYGNRFMENDDIRKLPVNNDLNMLHMVAAGRLDAAVGDRLILQELIVRNPRLRENIRLTSASLEDVSIHFGAIRGRGDAQAKVDAFNRGLNIIRDTGSLARILLEYEVDRLPYTRSLSGGSAD